MHNTSNGTVLNVGRFMFIIGYFPDERYVSKIIRDRAQVTSQEVYNLDLDKMFTRTKWTTFIHGLFVASLVLFMPTP